MNLPTLGNRSPVNQTDGGGLDDARSPLGSTIQSTFSKAGSTTALLHSSAPQHRSGAAVVYQVPSSAFLPVAAAAEEGVTPLLNDTLDGSYGSVNLRAPYATGEGDDDDDQSSTVAATPTPLCAAPRDDGVSDRETSERHRTAHDEEVGQAKHLNDDDENEDGEEYDGSPTSSPGDMRLYQIDEIPDRMKDNRNILGSYRAYYTLSMCIRSLWYIHNETVNIWTHFLGLLLFIALFAWFLATDVAPTEREPMHFIILFAFSLGLVTCLLCSTLFHLTNAHYSCKFSKVMHKLDYFGITTLVIGSFIPMIFLGFACSPIWKYVYLSIVLSMGSFGLIGPWFHFWTELKYHTFRVCVYVILTGSGVFPLIHVNFILPISETWPYTVGLAMEIMIYFLGLMIYVFQVPERWFPGRFDIWCHSHQVWHMFVLAAAFTHFATVAFMYRNWRYLPNEC